MVEEPLQALGPGLVGADFQFRNATGAEGGDELVSSGLSRLTPTVSDEGIARVDFEPNTMERYEIPIKITAGASGTGPSLRAAVA